MLETFLEAAFATAGIVVVGAVVWFHVRAQRERGSLWVTAARSADLADVGS